MTLRTLLLAASLIAATPLAAEHPQSPATGLEGAQGPAEVSLLSGWRREDGRHVAAIAIALAPGWHTYWRIPGESGIPPQFDWSASRNLTGAKVEWPRPIVFETAGFTSIGYADRVVLPIVLEAARPGAPIELDVSVFFGVCADICVPAEARLQARLSPDGAGSDRASIEVALADRPMTPARAGVTGATCSLTPGLDGPALSAEISFTADQPPGQMVVIESVRPGLRLGLAQTQARGRALHAAAPVSGAEGGLVLDRNGLRLTVLGADRAVEISGCAAPG